MGLFILAGILLMPDGLWWQEILSAAFLMSSGRIAQQRKLAVNGK
jgi:hypothetical protein